MTKTEIAKEFIQKCYENIKEGEAKPGITQIKEALRKAYPEEFLTYKSADNAVQYATKGRRKDTDRESINVLVIGDLHAPFIKTGYLEFCKNIYKKYNCSEVVFTGDILDNHFSSFFDTDADGLSAIDELNKARYIINKFHEAFPIARVCIGNHDKIPDRKAFASGLSKSWIRTIDEVLNVKGWTFAEEFVINGVLYTHGECRKARLRAIQEFTSVVQGHYHSESYYEVFVSESRMIFALQVGSGVDRHSYAMAYGKHFKKPQINVGVVMDSGRWAILEHMKL